MGDTLKTTIKTYQDLFTNSYKRTINWGTIQVLENVFYTKVSRIRRLTKTLNELEAIISTPLLKIKLFTLTREIVTVKAYQKQA